MDDPGWRGAMRFAIPIYGRLTVQRLGTPGIAPLRGVFISFVAEVLVFAVVTTFLVKWDTPAVAVLLLVTVVGIAALAIVTALRHRPLNPASPEELASSFVKTFFLMIATSEAVALLGFVLAFYLNRAPIVWLAAAFALIGFRLAAPDRTELARRQEQLATSGSSLSLLTALEGRPHPSP